VTQELISLALQECQRAGITRPAKIVVEVGSLSTYQAEPIQFYFDLLKAEEPVLQATALELQSVAALLRCQQCGDEFEVEDPWVLACPNCPDARTEIVRGKDVLLRSIIAAEDNDE